MYVCVIRRWIERGPSLIVSGYASKVVCAWLWVLNGVRYSWVDVRSLCVESSGLMRRNWFETTHVHVRPLTAHLRRNSARTNVSRPFHWHPLTVTYKTDVCVDVSDCKWYVCGSCVIQAWFVSDFCPPTHQKFGQFLDAQIQSVLICELIVCDRLCDWPFISYMYTFRTEIDKNVIVFKWIIMFNHSQNETTLITIKLLIVIIKYF